MTRLYFYVGRIRLKLLLFQFLSLSFFGLMEIFCLRRFLDLPEEQLQRQVALVALLLVAIFAGIAGFSWSYLRPVARVLENLRHQGDASLVHHDGLREKARQAALRFPLASITVALGITTLAIIAGVLADLVVFPIHPSLVAGMALGSFAALLLGCALLYVVHRAVLRPVIAHFRHEEVPVGMRISVRNKVILAIVALSLASAVPTALVGGRRVRTAHHRVAAKQAREIAEAVAYGATALPPEALRQAIASLRLSDATRIRLTNRPGPAASPLPANHAATYVEVLSQPMLSTDHTVLAVTVALLLGLAGLIAGVLGGNFSRDVALVTGRIAALARPSDGQQRIMPIIPGAPQFSDLRRLASAVNDLLVRITEIHVAHFVSIEKTLAADRMKMQFLANVSHDLRSPLNSILGFSELLLRDPSSQLTEPQQQALSLIHRRGTDLLGLIDQVLDLATLEAGRLVLHREDSLPAEIIRETLQELTRQGIPDGIKVETELQAGLSSVWVDPHRLGQTLKYIIRFCIETMERGRVIVNLRADTVVDAATDTARKILRIRVANTGRGLEEDEVARLFAGFRRKPGVRGLGLDLPLAKAFVEMHGATLQVFSTPGVGTTVAVDLPLTRHKALGRLRPVKV
jgi:signal transduction histidine kinase